MRQPANSATGLDTSRPSEAADRGARDEGARRPGGVRGVDLLGEVRDRDRGHAADQQTFEKPPGRAAAVVGGERNEQAEHGRAP